MKIIRVKRGFTTNSSGSDEYLQIEAPPPSSTQRQKSQNLQNQKQEGKEIQEEENILKDLSKESGTEEKMEAVISSPPSKGEAKQAHKGVGGMVALGFVLAGILLVIGIEKVIGFIRKKENKKKDKGDGN